MIEPLVSVVIPVGPGHERLAYDAVRSVLWQTSPRVVAVVAWDAGEQELPEFIKAFEPYIGSRVFPAGPATWQHGPNRPAVARNRGIVTVRDRIKSPFIVFLDSDDYLLRDGVATLLYEHKRHDQAYSYGGAYDTTGGRAGQGPYQQSHYAHYNLHAITCLLTTADVVTVGGFDEYAPGFEDWTLFAKFALAGYCGKSVPVFPFVYRHQFGQVHITDRDGGIDVMNATIAPYLTGPGREFKTAMCGCSSAATAARDEIFAADAPPRIESETTLEYTGTATGSVSFRVPGTGSTFKVSSAPSRRYLVNVQPHDAEYLLSLGIFRRTPIDNVFEGPPVAPVVVPPAIEPPAITDDDLSDSEAVAIAEMTALQHIENTEDLDDGFDIGSVIVQPTAEDIAMGIYPKSIEQPVEETEQVEPASSTPASSRRRSRRNGSKNA